MDLEIDFDYIDIVYENCDVVRIPADLIERVNVIDLVQTINSYQHGKAEYRYKCEHVEMELHEEAGNLLTLMDTKYTPAEIVGNYSNYRPSTFFEHVKNEPSTTHIAICKDEDTLYYISVPYTDMFGESYRNYYEKITRSIWDKNPIYSIKKSNLRGIALWKYLKMEVRMFPHNYFFRRIRVRVSNFFINIAENNDLFRVPLRK